MKHCGRHDEDYIRRAWNRGSGHIYICAESVRSVDYFLPIDHFGMASRQPSHRRRSHTTVPEIDEFVCADTTEEATGVGMEAGILGQEVTEETHDTGLHRSENTHAHPYTHTHA